MNKTILSILCAVSLSAATPAQAGWYDWIPGISWFAGWQKHVYNNTINKLVLENQFELEKIKTVNSSGIFWQEYPICERHIIITPKDKIYLEIQTDSEDSQLEIRYEVKLKDKSTGKELGHVKFSYDKGRKSGYISLLKVPREERKCSYGSILLKFALEKLSAQNCKGGITWQAYPFDLNPYESQEEMLPKLIAFYQRHGAQLISQNKWSAEMAYYPPKDIRKKIKNLKTMEQKMQLVLKWPSTLAALTLAGVKLKSWREG
jgi:hypothetical protein